MTDDYPAEWLPEYDKPPCPDELDPSSGEFLSPWAPTAAQRSRVDELALHFVERAPELSVTFLRFSRDCYQDRSWPQVVFAILELFNQTAIGAQGYELTIARLRSDLEHARAEALEEMQR